MIYVQDLMCMFLACWYSSAYSMTLPETFSDSQSLPVWDRTFNIPWYSWYSSFLMGAQWEGPPCEWGHSPPDLDWGFPWGFPSGWHRTQTPAPPSCRTGAAPGWGCGPADGLSGPWKCPDTTTGSCATAASGLRRDQNCPEKTPPQQVSQPSDTGEL